mmetsp:Transcript_117188/g.184334  ORF Transcript_117188/g.184334 Transcript_117188/m.184334 type:complete len:267 (+) Transcript_117188:41-841(+)
MDKPKQSWKEYAGRDWGPDGYRFGDLFRHTFKKGSRSSNEPNSAAIDDNDRAILDLKVQKDDIVKYRKRMEVQTSKAQDAAKLAVSQGRKEQAMLYLRKKKQLEQIFTDANNQIMRLEEMISNIEFAHVQKEVVGALADGVKTLKKVQEEMGGVDSINRLMDECADAVEAQREINDALANAGIAADDEDALEEYNRLVEAQALDQLQQSSLTTPDNLAVEKPVVQPVVEAPVVQHVATAPVVQPAFETPVIPSSEAQQTAKQAVPA